MKNFILAFGLFLLSFSSHAFVSCTDTFTKKIVASSTLTVLRHLAVSGSSMHLTLMSEGFNMQTTATKKTATYAIVKFQTEGSFLVEVTLVYTNSERDGLKPPKWELTDQAFVQAGKFGVNDKYGAKELDGQKISIHRSTTPLPKSADSESYQREYFELFEAPENWFANISIVSMRQLEVANEAPNWIYLSGHMF